GSPMNGRKLTPSATPATPQVTLMATIRLWYVRPDPLDASCAASPSSGSYRLASSNKRTIWKRRSSGTARALERWGGLHGNSNGWNGQVDRRARLAPQFGPHVGVQPLVVPTVTVDFTGKRTSHHAERDGNIFLSPEGSGPFCVRTEFPPGRRNRRKSG